MSDKKVKFGSLYVDELIERLKIIYPDLDEEDIRTLVKRECKKNMVKVPIKFNDEKCSIMDLANYFLREEPIISGYGTVFAQHEDIMSPEYKMVQDFIDLRKVYKNKKFEHINDKDKTKFNLYDIFQLTYKLLNNSYFGASLEPNSFFYNPYIGPSILNSGVIVIQTAVNLFEKFLSNNFEFRTFNDLTLYVKNIINEPYDIYEYIDEPFLAKRNIISYLLSHFKEVDNDIEEKVKTLVSNLDKSDWHKIYIKNNLYEAINHSTILDSNIKSIIGNTTFLDPNEPPEEFKEALEKIWEVLNICVHYNYLDWYRKENAEKGTRYSVLTIKWCRWS